MGIDDLQVTHEIDGKYVNFQLESRKAALINWKTWPNIECVATIISTCCK